MSTAVTTVRPWVPRLRATDPARFTLNEVARCTRFVEQFSRTSKDGDPQPAKRPELAALSSANIVTSELGDGRHAPVLDLDIPATYVRSSTPGHGHLYVDVPMTWEQYSILLLVLGQVGILEPGYVRASLARGYSAVRLPWVKKEAA